AVTRPLHLAQASSGPADSRPVRLRLVPIAIPATAMAASTNSTRRTHEPRLLVARLKIRRSSTLMRPHSQLPRACNETTYQETRLPFTTYAAISVTKRFLAGVSRGRALH